MDIRSIGVSASIENLPVSIRPRISQVDTRACASFLCTTSVGRSSVLCGPGDAWSCDLIYCLRNALVGQVLWPLEPDQDENRIFNSLPGIVLCMHNPEHLAKFHDFASRCQPAALSHSRVFSMTKSISFCVSSGKIGNEMQEAAFRSEFGIALAMRAGLPHG